MSEKWWEQGEAYERARVLETKKKGYVAPVPPYFQQNSQPPQSIILDKLALLNKPPVICWVCFSPISIRAKYCPTCGDTAD